MATDSSWDLTSGDAAIKDLLNKGEAVATWGSVTGDAAGLAGEPEPTDFNSWDFLHLFSLPKCEKDATDDENEMHANVLFLLLSFFT